MTTKEQKVDYQKNLRLLFKMLEDDRNNFFASLPKGLSDKEKNKRFFLYKHENDFSEEEKKKIIEHIERK
jgi:hypothetical protein